MPRSLSPPPGRPDADELLARLHEEERRAKRGKLTVFFGAAPGVGKTYAMLEAARSERDLRRDVVIGIVETHGRYDTAALTIGLELLPRRKIDYRGVKLDELDLDAALLRRPGLILVDELAHTNAEGSRHTKRWQDVEELLEAGIDVYTTVNVQHLESLNDVIAQITGIIVRETVPDRIIEQADEIRLIDLPPNELLERLQEGKVYLPRQAGRALQGFFKKGSLTALRELALRQTAERVDQQMRSQRHAEGIDRAWPVAERILVCVSPSPDSARLIRAARRMSATARTAWIAAYVETPISLRMAESDRQRVAEHLRLAEELGGETVRLSGESAADELIRYARTRNVTKIVVGKPTHPRWRDIIRQSFLDELVRATPDIDIHVITGRTHESEQPGKSTNDAASRAGTGGAGEAAAASAAAAVERSRTRRGYLAACVAVALSTVLAWTLFGRGELADVVMVFLLGIVLVSVRFGFGASIFATVLSILAFDFFFVRPYMTFAVADLRHTVTFAVMFVVAIVIGRLTKRIRDQADTARQRELRFSRLYAMSRELADTSSLSEVIRIAKRHVGEAFDAIQHVAILLPDGQGRFGARNDEDDLLSAFDGVGLQQRKSDRNVVDWVWAHGKTAGLGTDTLPSASARFLLLRGGGVGKGGGGAGDRKDEAPAPLRKVGILAVRPKNPRSLIDPEQRLLLETFASQIATAIERVRLAEDARRGEIEMETERLRSSLLSSVSHDLRTPLGVITGATSALLRDDDDDGAIGADPNRKKLNAATRRDLLESAHEEAQRLNRLVKNLLDMTKLAAGAIHPKKEWHPLEEVVGVALRRVDQYVGSRPIKLNLPLDLPPVPLDDLLIEQVLFNLLDNAIKYTPAGSPITLSARELPDHSAIEIEIADEGPGVPPHEREHIFEKFYRLKKQGDVGAAGADVQPAGGAGLGLAICRGFVEAHGGKIWVADDDGAGREGEGEGEGGGGGGARFRFTLPLDAPLPPPPLLKEEEDGAPQDEDDHRA